MVARTIGMSRDTIRRGVEELQGSAGPHRGIRRPGGGRKKTIDSDPKLKEDLEKLLSPAERGDPESPLRWTSKSVRHLAGELERVGHQMSHRMVADLLHYLGYSLQANARPWKDRAIRIAMLSSKTSITKRRSILRRPTR